MSANKIVLTVLIFMLIFGGGPSIAANPEASTGELEAIKSLMLTDPEGALARTRAAIKRRQSSPGASSQSTEVMALTWLSGEALVRLDRPTEAEAALKQALVEVGPALQGSELHANILKSLGAAEASNGNIQGALAEFQAAFNIYKALGLAREQSVTLQEIGSLYQDARDYQKSLRYYAEARELYSADTKIELVLSNNTAFAYKELKRYPEAAAEFRRALRAAQTLKIPYVQVSILSNLAFVEALQGQWPAARANIASGLELTRRFREARAERPFLLGVMAKIAASQGNIPTAGRLLDEMFAGIPLDQTDSAFRDFHELAAMVFEETGQEDKALRHLKAMKRLDDQGSLLAASANAALMAARFDFANQAARISDLKLSQVRAKARFMTILMSILALSGLVVAGLIAHAFVTMKRSRDRIRAANEGLEISNTALEKALKAKTEFLATTSHEIRTPLNGILGMTQVMLADQNIPDGIRDRLEIVRSSGEAMNALVNDLLDVAKIETGNLTVEPVELDLRDLLSSIARMWSDQARNKGIDFKVDLSRSPDRIVGDSDRIRQVLFNLLSNAIKFTEHGTVSMSVDVVESGLGEQLVVAISDTGIGIQESEVDRVFESFTQLDAGKDRQYAGTGLGLTICRSIAEALNGEITVSSRLGVGSTFSLTMPLERPASRSDSAELTDVGRVRRILVLDGNPLSQALYRAALTNGDANLFFVGDASDALGAMESQHFDTVIVDGVSVIRSFPDDSLGFISRLCQAADAPVVALWPGPIDEVQSQILALGVWQVFEKPILPATLFDAILIFDRGPTEATAALVKGRLP